MQIPLSEDSQTSYDVRKEKKEQQTHCLSQKKMRMTTITLLLLPKTPPTELNTTSHHLPQENCEGKHKESAGVIHEENSDNRTLLDKLKAEGVAAERDSDNESLSKNPYYWNNWHLWRRRESDYSMTKSEEDAELRKIDEEIARNPQTPSSLASIPPPIETTPGGTRRMTIRDYEAGRVDVEAIQRRMFGPHNVKFVDDSTRENTRQDPTASDSGPLADNDPVYVSRHARNKEDINLNINIRVSVSAAQDDIIGTSTRVQQQTPSSEKDTGGSSKQHPTKSSNQQSTKTIEKDGLFKWGLFNEPGYVAVISLLSFALGYSICLNMQR